MPPPFAHESSLLPLARTLGTADAGAKPDFGGIVNVWRKGKERTRHKRFPRGTPNMTETKRLATGTQNSEGVTPKVKRRSPKGYLAVLGCLAVALSTSVGQPQASQAAGPAEVLQDQYDRLDAIRAVADEIRVLQPTLAMEMEQNFAGAWVDENGNPHVATAHGDNGIKRIAEAGLSRAPIMHAYALSLAQLAALQDRIDADARAAGWTLADAEVATIGQDLVNNRVEIELVKPTAGQMAAVAATYGDAVYVETVDEAPKPASCYEYDCPNPMKAGLRSYNSAGAERGMTAFVFRRTDGSGYLVSTAGHAVNLNEAIYHPAVTYRGTVLYDIDNGQSIDAALWSISSSQAGNKLFDYDGYANVGSITSVETEAGSVVGEPVCKSGRYDWICGTIQSKDRDLAWVYNQYEANLWGRGGDSGAPIFYGTKAHGIAVGNYCDGCSQLYYTPIKRVEEFWSNAFMVLTYQP